MNADIRFVGCDHPGGGTRPALPVRSLHLSLDESVYTSLPVWIKADLGYPGDARYPYREDPSDFGPNEIEFKRVSETILPPSFLRVGNFRNTGWLGCFSQCTDK